MDLRAALVGPITRRRALRGRRHLLRVLDALMPYRTYLESRYGVLLKENRSDLTWRLAFFGYPDETVASEVLSIPSGACFIDIGANAGVFSILAAKRVGPDGVVLSFEPNLSVFSDLVENALKNEIQCLFMPFNMAIAAASTVSHMTFNPAHSGKSFLAAEGTSRTVPVLAWSELSFLETIIDNRPVIIKVDVEGAEGQVLRGMSRFLRTESVKKVIVELDDRLLGRFDSSKAEVYDIMQACGFRAQHIHDARHFDEVFVK